jgi:hypothetical protein
LELLLPIYGQPLISGIAAGVSLVERTVGIWISIYGAEMMCPSVRSSFFEITDPGG